MAGIVVLSHGDWTCSGQAFRAMAEGVMRHLGTDDAGAAIRAELGSAIESNLCFVDTKESFTTEMLCQFRTSVDRLIEEEEKKPVGTFVEPSHQSGYLARLRDLQMKLGDTRTDILSNEVHLRPARKTVPHHKSGEA